MQPQQPAKRQKIQKSVRFSNSTNTKDIRRTLGEVLRMFTHAENPVEIRVYSSVKDNHKYDQYSYVNGELNSIGNPSFQIQLNTSISTKIRHQFLNSYIDLSKKLVDLQLASMFNANSQTNSSQEAQVATGQSLYTSAVTACNEIKKNFNFGCDHFIFISAPVAATQAIAIKDLLRRGFVLKKEGNGNVNANAIIGENLQLKYFEGVYCVL